MLLNKNTGTQLISATNLLYFKCFGTLRFTWGLGFCLFLPLGSLPAKHQYGLSRARLNNAMLFLEIWRTLVDEAILPYLTLHHS